MTGVGLGPEEGSGTLGGPEGIGDKAGRRVVGDGSVELRSSVVTARVAPAWAFTEAQQFRSNSKIVWRPGGPIATANPRGPRVAW